MSRPHAMMRDAAREASTPLIALDAVTYRYPGAGPEWQPPALDGITLGVRRGAYVLVLGHNGSGKSSLARLMNGLLAPTSGRVTVAGLDTRDVGSARRIRDRVGLVLSDPDNQIIATVVEDDVAWALAARGFPRAEIAARVDGALAAVGLREMRHLPPHELSGGQRQRLALAGVLALRPDCVVADEPTALLDPLARQEVSALLGDLCRGHGLTIVHTTHLLEEAARADRVIVLAHGRIALEGAPSAIFADLARLRALHLAVPEVAVLAERLRTLGVPIPPGTVTPEALVAALPAPEEAP